VVEVRDNGGEWESGVVVEIKDDDQREEVMVLKDQWDTPYCWDEIRHLVGCLYCICLYVCMCVCVFVEGNSLSLSMCIWLSMWLHNVPKGGEFI
jgi:hypothetical protein